MYDPALVLKRCSKKGSILVERVTMGINFPFSHCTVAERVGKLRYHSESFIVSDIQGKMATFLNLVSSILFHLNRP